MNVKLTNSEINILATRLSLSSVTEKAISRLANVSDLSGKYDLELTADELLSTIEELQDLFLKVGLLPTCEPNDKGLTIETLIDKLINIRSLYPATEMDNPKQAPDIEALIQYELGVFPSLEMKQTFLSVRQSPAEVVQDWDYETESHRCWIIAKNAKFQIVYCQTGLGASFPWGFQVLGQTHLGNDGQWFEHLYEAFSQSGMWTSPSRNGKTRPPVGNH